MEKKNRHFFSPLSTQNLTRFANFLLLKKNLQIFGIQNLQKKKTHTQIYLHIHTHTRFGRSTDSFFFLKNVLAVSENKILGKKIGKNWPYLK